jgi:putative ABC transport system ATP-binding protein
MASPHVFLENAAMTVAADTSAPLIRAQSLSRTFTMGDVQVPALVDADLEIRAGEFIVLLGPSGSGKTTLLNLIGGMDQPSAGRVWFRKTELSGMDEDGRTSYRRESVGFIFQFYNLVPTLTAQENVQVATELVDNPLDPVQALEIVGLAERAEHFPSQLSGGEQQRVAIARALAKRPELLLADEPTGALDVTAARVVLAILQRLCRGRSLTVVLVTHNTAIAAIADRVVRMVSGRIAEISGNERPIAATDVSW